MPDSTITLFDPFLGLVSGSGDATMLLTDSDDDMFDLPDQTGDNQAAYLDGLSVTVNDIEQAIGPQLVVAMVDGLQVELSLTPIRITVEDGFFDKSYVYFPGLPEGAEILIGLSLPLLFPLDGQIPLCLCSKTLLKTDRGLKPIGEICVGDMVATLDNGHQAVRWVGKQCVDFMNNPEMQNHTPILIQKNAFGENRPFQELILSPQHAVMLDGWEPLVFTGQDEVFASAKSLVNETSVCNLPDCTEIEYCHILFDQHHVIWAQGLTVESLFLGDLAKDHILHQKRAELLSVFPDLDALRKNFKQRARSKVKPYEVAAMYEICV
ncbi:hypothetical protein GCM10008927_01190 [Amylibacter ulvae]|uniref:Hedgehog/Intein (Hint) domain-containing protein n=1 Tax=Paramylibacter ulvae TaxID=1651968 RepID=A0ABQ3CRJ2_9RHOB|nr:Hint domain-containing protein [Amylibacter ulvae]GHA40722.1 hypothetical protein GCM10008927_01190 [Amylibacter ulvae]